MRLPNGYGSVTKLSGARRKPYIARITKDCVYDEEKGDYVQKRIILGYYAKRSEALDALAAYNNNPSILDSDMTIQELWESIKDDVKATEDRKKVYERAFYHYMKPLHNMKMKDIKTKHLQAVIDDCDKGYSTKSNIRVVMNHIFRFAAQNDIVAKNYVDFIEFEQEQTILERQVYTDDEIEKLWAHADLEEYAITLVLLHQGMRIKELMDLTKDDVDFEKKTIVIRKAKNAYSERTIPMNTHVIEQLKLLYDLPGDKLTTINKNKYEYFTSKVLNHRAYDVRHTFATKCNKLGINKLIIQRIMGHKPDSILEQVYTHLTLEEISEELEKIKYVQ